MNSASQNFQHHLATLRERMLHPTDYEKAVHYFLEEFAGDQAFVKASEVDFMPHLVAVLAGDRGRGLPVSYDNSGDQIMPSYRIHGAMTWRFQTIQVSTRSRRIVSRPFENTCGNFA